MSYISIPFISTAVLNFMVASLEIYQRYKKQLLTALVLSFVFFFLAFSHKAFLVGMKSYWWGYYPQYGWLGFVFVIFLSSVLIGGLFISLIEYRRLPHGLKKLRIQSFIFAYAISVFGIVDFLPKFGVAIYPFGYIPLLFFILICARTVWFYSLADITPALVANKVFNSIEDALLLIDMGGLIRVANRTAEIIFHKSSISLINKPIKTLIDNDLFLEKYEELLGGRTSKSFDITYTNNGSSVTLSVSMSLMLDQTKQPCVIICIFRDITDLKKSQISLLISEKLAAMGQLSAGLAHELNSPLAGLLPLLEKYKKEAEPYSEMYGDFNLMFLASEHMAKIVRDFGSFAGKPSEKFTELDLEDVIESTLSFSSVHLTQKGIEIIKQYSDELPKIQGDKTELQQVVLNIITNACDAMPDGGRFVISTGASRDDNNVMIEFIDNGTGIKKEDLDNVFLPFFTTKPQGKGIGLGLSVSYGIIKNHKGEISVESEPDRGSKFTILFPQSQ